MPLVVKLKNPNHSKALQADEDAGATSLPPEDPVEERAAVGLKSEVGAVTGPGQSESMHPDIPKVRHEEVGVRFKEEEPTFKEEDRQRYGPTASLQDDSGIDDLASAFAQSSIQEQQEVGNVRRGMTEPVAPTALLSASIVDVLVAPAVLGHRYVRGRDTSFIVERPERIRGVLLGLSAVLARLEQEFEAGTTDAGSELSDRLNALNFNAEIGKTMTSEETSYSNPFEVLLSSRSLDLTNTNEIALSYIHAHPDELLSSEAQGEPSQYAVKEAAKAAHSSSSDAVTATQALPASYAAFLARLCSQAPFSAPPPRPSRSPRKLRSPPKVREANESSSSSDEEESTARLSEVPVHMPQGDLYLCGPRKEALLVKKEAEDGVSNYFEQRTPSTPENHTQLADPKTPDGSAKQSTSLPYSSDPQTPQARPQNLVQIKGPVDEGQGTQWTAKGTRGAIEAALGACCTAVDRVVQAAASSGSVKIEPQNVTVESVHVNGLLKSLRPAPLREHEDEKSPTASEFSRPPSKRAFVLTRPPGHHCSATQPSGFCWVNNVAVLAAHAYEAHGIDRIAVLDIDLHHGNGTQSLVWRINADAVRKDAERDAKLAANSKVKVRGPRRSAGASVVEQEMNVGRRGLKMFYGSLHDIESFPCEDGDESLVKDASTCIMGAHGQWIWNIHLDSHSSPSEFSELYANKYRTLLSRADEFFARTDPSPSKSLIVLSTGFDACQHELPGMQRHGKYVPVSFYETFTRDVIEQLAEKRTSGKVISVLEGGYSERALVSATIAHLVGLLSPSSTVPDSNTVFAATESAAKEGDKPPRASREAWYGLPALLALEKIVTKQVGSAHGFSGSSGSASAHATPLAKRKGFQPDGGNNSNGDWLGAAMEAFWRMWEACGHPRPSPSQVAAGSGRDRRAAGGGSAAGLLKPISPATPRELRSARATNASG